MYEYSMQFISIMEKLGGKDKKVFHDKKDHK